MYYYQNRDTREKNLTIDFVRNHVRMLDQELDLSFKDMIIVELQKARYGREGDVDLAVLKNATPHTQILIAVEIKVLHLNENGQWKSEKETNHNKQINKLFSEGWDYIYFFDFIVTKEQPTWFHSQSFDGFNGYRKSVDDPRCGHILFQLNPLTGRPQADAGSISVQKLKEAQRNDENGIRSNILDAIRGIEFSGSRIFIDGV